MFEALCSLAESPANLVDKLNCLDHARSTGVVPTELTSIIDTFIRSEIHFPAESAVKWGERTAELVELFDKLIMRKAGRSS
jgi:hypothetical protein